MVYCPKEGAILELGAGQSVFTFHTGAVFILSGQVRYRLESEGIEPYYYTLGPGALIGLEQAQLPENLLKAQVLEPINARAWSLKSLEMYVGKDLQFALCGLISLSSQQRRLNQELARRWQAHTQVEQLAVLAEQNAQAGNTAMADVFYQRLVGTYPHHEMTHSIREALALMRKEHTGTGPLQISTALPALSQETQLSLYQLAFGGVDGLNQDILQRFGRVFAAGETLCQQGEAGDELFLLLKGSVEISRQGTPLAQCFAGDLVGEMAVLEGQTRSATVTAQEETLTLALSREHFQMIFQLHPSWTWKLLQGFSLRLANAWQLLARGKRLVAGGS